MHHRIIHHDMMGFCLAGSTRNLRARQEHHRRDRPLAERQRGLAAFAVCPFHLRHLPRQEEMPFARNPFESVGATVNEFDSRSHDQVLHGTGNQHFSRIRLVRDSGSNVHR